MTRIVQAPLPPMEVRSVDRTKADRSTAVDRWLALMNRAIDESAWRHKQDALATFMALDKAYLSRLRSAEKPWRIEHVVALPDDIATAFLTLHAQSFGLIVVTPLSGDDAVIAFVGGFVGILRQVQRAVDELAESA